MYKQKLPDEVVAKMKEMWRDQKTGSEIALALGMTRNAVMGMLNRLRVKGELGYRKLKFMGRTPNKRPSRALVPSVRSTVVVDPPRVSTVPSPHLVVCKPEPRPEFVPGPDNGVKLEDLGHWHCRWVISEVQPKVFRFCGATKKHASSYCPEHHALVYLPRTKAAPKPDATQPSRPISTWRAMQ